MVSAASSITTWFTGSANYVLQTRPIINFRSIISGKSDSTPRWNERASKYLTSCEAKLDVLMPNFFVQNKADALGRFIKSYFSPLQKFSQWLDSNGHGMWYEQLAISLAKLPAKAVRNILRTLYNLIEGILYTAVHPLKSSCNLTKLFINVLNELTKPEVWAKIGVGMVGAFLGQSLVTGNPVSIIGLGIGGGLAAAGLSATFLKTLLNSEEGKRYEAAKQFLFKSALELPETFVTGLCMGLLIGGIQRAVQKYVKAKTKSHQAEKQRTSNVKSKASNTNVARIKDIEEGYKIADYVVKKYDLPEYSDVQLSPDGNLTIVWAGRDLKHLDFLQPAKQGSDIVDILDAKMFISPQEQSFIVRYSGCTSDYEYCATWSRNFSMVRDLGITENLYPATPVSPPGSAIA